MSQSPEALAELLPSASPTDSESVKTCLDTAQALWKKGDLRDAVRWLQRGASAAEEAGDDDRALSIARRAADLSTHVGPPSQRTPEGSSPPSVRRPGQSGTPPLPARRASSVPPPRPSASAPPASVQPAAPAVALAAQNELIAQGRAVRVAVKRSALDGALYVVRPLGEKVASGAREALLILSEPDPAFFSNAGNKG
jgi:hypothetical protein